MAAETMRPPWSGIINVLIDQMRVPFNCECFCLIDWLNCGTVPLPRCGIVVWHGGGFSGMTPVKWKLWPNRSLAGTASRFPVWSRSRNFLFFSSFFFVFDNNWKPWYRNKIAASLSGSGSFFYASVKKKYVSERYYI